MIDVKKLSIGFLILAVAVSASALLVSNLGGSVSANGNVADTAITVTALDGQSTSTDGSAFLPQSTQAADEVLANTDPKDNAVTDPALASSTDAIISDPNNLTNILANSYLDGLASTNPNGAQDDGSGNQTLTPPDPNAVIAQFESSSTSASVQLPDWEAEAEQVPLTIVSSSPNAIATYGTALNQILDQDVVQTNLQSMLTGNSDPSFEPYVASKIQTALQDISGLQTPTSTVALQESLIKTLVYAKNEIALAENASVDPVKAELILGGEDPRYTTALQDLQTQLQKVQSENLFSLANVSPIGKQTPGNKVLADLQSIFGIQVAHALIPVYDPVNHVVLWANLGQLIKQDLENIALQIVKNTLVFIMQKTIFAAIKGSGAPAFIQQWGMTLANAAQQSALGALNAQMKCVSAAPFADQLRLTLGATYKPGNNNVCAVQYNNQLNNNLSSLTKFYNNFSGGGGWVTFGATLQPDNNYYGSAFFIAQTVGNTGQLAQNGAQAKAIAGGGFGGSATCKDGSDPKGSTLICIDGSGHESETNSNTCPAHTTPYETLPNNGFCSNGQEPSVQTPGAVFNGMVNSAVDGNFKLITSANNWVGLASGLFVSILQETLNSLAKTTIADAQGLLQQAYSGGGATNVTNSGGVGGTYTVTQGASSPASLFCYVSASPDSNPLAAELTAGGQGAITSNGNSAPVAITPSYTWSTTQGTVSPAAGPGTIATFNAPGTYQVLLTDVNDNTRTICSVTIPQQ